MPMTNKLIDAIDALAEKAAACASDSNLPGPQPHQSLAAMQFSQAALNLANAARVLDEVSWVHRTA